MEIDKISIIVPIYNVENFLCRCVESLTSQSYKNLEIILVDDGSTDSSGIIADELAQNDDRIVTYHKENGGLSDARNYGLSVATGKFILYVDSDDYIEEDACMKLMERMQPDIDFVIGAYKEVNNDRTIEKRHTNIVDGKKYTSKEFTILAICKNEWYAPSWLNLYKREFLLKNNLYFKKGRLFEDHQILPRLFLSANKVAYLDFPFYNYIIRNNSIMTSGDMIKKLEMSLLNYNEWMEQFVNVKDKQFQRYLYGVLVRYYLATCRSLNISGWNVKNMNFMFAFKYALNIKERIKIIIFHFVPKLFLKLR